VEFEQYPVVLLMTNPGAPQLEGGGLRRPRTRTSITSRACTVR
jgi:hypothetical protein